MVPPFWVPMIIFIGPFCFYTTLMFNQPPNKPNFSELEDQITEWWKDNDTFDKSVEQRSEDNFYSFLDGPPFVTGMPHYAQLLPRIAKDVIPRYQAMKGKRVRRVWGWDCHGLPIEEKVEKQLGLKSKRDIEELGMDKFITECRKYVENVSSDWEWYVDKIGHWVDFHGAYYTMNKDYMESVIWVFKELYDKGLIYEGVKTLLYCTRCGTPVSRFEIAMDDSYSEVTDPTITVEFPVTTEGDFKGTNVLAWTTTPWTMPSNRALVVDPKETYVEFTGMDEVKKYVVAKKRLDSVVGEEERNVIREFPGSELVGLSYQGPYDFYTPNENDWKIYSFEGMVHMGEGTGIVHSAPGFGEIDTEMGLHYGLTTMFTVDDEGKFVDQVEDFKGIYVKDADPKIIEDLKNKELLFAEGTTLHRYPYCYRCNTPLIQRAQKAWFVNIQDSKEDFLKKNEVIKWVPEKFRKRFINTIETAPDWNVSRNRYWATAMPVWRCDKCDDVEVLGSIAEMERKSGQKVEDLHRNVMDQVKFECSKCNGTMTRIPEVLDCWMESGSMPYGQIHYPFENKELFQKTYPADYIVEYVGQIRAWFYYMHAVSNLLMNENSFKNVVVTGVMWGDDGRKMSKSFNNFPDPKDMLINYGGDALRLYFMSSPIMLGEDMNFNEKDLQDQVKTFLFPLWNSYKYLITYGNINGWKPKAELAYNGRTIWDDKHPWDHIPFDDIENELDAWILTELQNTIGKATEALDNFEMPDYVKTLKEFITEVSKWYIRRSRDRFAAGEERAMETLYYILVELIKLAAPVTPFISEYIYRQLVSEQIPEEKESVHLTDFPVLDANFFAQNKSVLQEMSIVRTITEMGQTIRANTGLKVRQPLSLLEVKFTKELLEGGIDLSDWMMRLISDELNIREVREVPELNTKESFEILEDKLSGISVAIDKELTEELKEAGLVRELIRTIQSLRKQAGMEMGEEIEVQFSSESDFVNKAFDNHKEAIKEAVTARKLVSGEATLEQIVNGEVVKLTLSKTDVE